MGRAPLSRCSHLRPVTLAWLPRRVPRPRFRACSPSSISPPDHQGETKRGLPGIDVACVLCFLLFGSRAHVPPVGLGRGTYAAPGAANVTSANISGAGGLLSTNNLSDVASEPTAAQNPKVREG